ncbi:hypothetical protein Tco_0472936 [Tanacetum coccineum]
MEIPNVPLSQEIDTGGSPRCQEAMGGSIAQTRSKRIPTPSYDSPLLGGNTPGSDEERIEHQDDLTDFVPPTPYDSPLLGGHTRRSDEGGASNKEGDQNVQDFRAELDNLLVQQKEGYATSTNRVSTVSPSVSVARKSFDNVDDLPTDPLMYDLEDTADLLNTGVFSGAYDDEDVGAEAGLYNLETTMNVSPIPTTRIHKDC